MGKKLFSGSCLSHNQHIGIHPAVTLCHENILPDGRAASNDVVKGILCRKPLLRKALPDFSLCLNNLLGVAGNNDGALSHLVHQHGPVFRIQFPVLPLDNLLPFPSGLHHILPFKGRTDLLHGTARVVSLGGELKGTVRLVIQCLNQPAAADGNQGIGTGVEDGAGHLGPGPLHIDGPGRIHGLLQGLLYGDILCVDVDPVQCLFIAQSAHGTGSHKHIGAIGPGTVDGFQGGGLVMDRIIRNLRLAQLFQLGHSALIHIPHTEGYLLGMELLSGANQGFQYIKAGELYLHHMLFRKQIPEAVISHAPGH